jgi:glycosyltransferase involved in cell wall biosynthesis
LLIPAIGEVLQQLPDAALVIAGDGDPVLVQSLHRQAQTCGVENSILWTGFLSGQAKFEAIADADVFVLPSYSENFGVAVVEAMSMGVPVIVTDQVGIHKEIADARAGLVIGTSVAPIAAGILRLLNDDEECAEMGQNGIALAHSHFNADNVIQSLIETYRTALKGNRRAEFVVTPTTGVGTGRQTTGKL